MKRHALLFAITAAAASMAGGCGSTSAQIYSNGYAPGAPYNYAPNYTPNAPYSYTPSFAPAPPVSAAADSDVRFTAEQLDQMLGPIALYPDPLLTEVLAACTYPQDVADLGQMLQYDSTPDDDEIASKPWDNSVKALAKYPSVVQMMASQMDWTRAIGAAMVNQPQEVMDSVQRLRAQARAANTLVTTPQQEVVQNSGVIQILPAQPQVIYVPTYDPLVVYEPQPFGTWITFGTGIGINRWWDLDCDWNNRYIRRGVTWGRDWRRPVITNNNWRWEHDRRRPIPVPQRAFVPPRGVDHRGWTGNARTPGALNPGVTPRVRAQPAPITPQRTQQQRAVQGLPQAPARQATRVPNVPQTPRQAPPAIPRVTTPAPTPVRPATPAPPRVTTPAAPTAPRAAPATPVTPRFSTPAAPVQPRVQPAAPAQRPVTGLPQRTVAPQPARPAAPAPRANPAPAPRAAPSPAFRPSGGAGSNRGHSSMRR